MTELIICTIGCAVTLIAEHIGLWRHPWRLSPPITYIIGVLTLCFWFAIWAAWIGVLGAAVAFFFLAGGSGSCVILAYWLRSRLDILKQQSRKAGQASVPFSPYLRQEEIDHGGRHN